MPIYILEAEIVLGVLYRKGVIPKKGGTLDSRDLGTRKQQGRSAKGEAKDKEFQKKGARRGGGSY